MSVEEEPNGFIILVKIIEPDVKGQCQQWNLNES